MVNNYMTVILRWMESYHGFICREQGSLQGSESLSRLVQSAFFILQEIPFPLTCESISCKAKNNYPTQWGNPADEVFHQFKEESIWHFLKAQA